MDFFCFFFPSLDEAVGASLLISLRLIAFIWASSPSGGCFFGARASCGAAGGASGAGLSSAAGDSGLGAGPSGAGMSISTAAALSPKARFSASAAWDRISWDTAAPLRATSMARWARCTRTWTGYPPKTANTPSGKGQLAKVC